MKPRRAYFGTSVRSSRRHVPPLLTAALALPAGGGSGGRRGRARGAGRPADRAAADRVRRLRRRPPAGVRARRRRARPSWRRHRAHQRRRGRTSRATARATRCGCGSTTPPSTASARAGRRVQFTLSGPGAARGRPATAARARDAPSARATPRSRARWPRHFRGRVARYAIWNEPNWWSLLRPRARSAARSTGGCTCAAARPCKHADPGAKVLIGELAPLGQPEAATPPLRFLRRLTCSDRRWRATRRCPRLVADGFAHHPYTLRWAPDYPGPRPRRRHDGLAARASPGRSTASRAARALATPRGRRCPLYLTEWGYHARSARVREPLRSRLRPPRPRARGPHPPRPRGRLVPARRPAARPPTCTGTRRLLRRPRPPAARVRRRARLVARAAASARGRRSRCRPP